MDSVTTKLLSSLKATAASHFNAAKRLQARERKLTQLTAFSSVYVIALTVLPYVLKTSPEVTDLYNLVTVALSLVILVASLLQYSTGDAVNAEQFHRSGLELNETVRLIQVKKQNGELTEADLLDFSQRYSATLQKYSVNHEEIDYLKFQLERPEDFKWSGRFRGCRIWLRIMWNKYLPTFFLLLITLFMAWLVLRYGPEHSPTPNSPSQIQAPASGKH